MSISEQKVSLQIRLKAYQDEISKILNSKDTGDDGKVQSDGK